ncbi:MAG: riboflavin kinase [Hadesarchaea archaeon]|nr:MAG: riboflavin kinase [Hadesarchaea archaeon]HDI12533.1 DUF120 domain-containing protein [Hadesarchaea archaeon]
MLGGIVSFFRHFTILRKFKRWEGSLDWGKYLGETILIETITKLFKNGVRRGGTRISLNVLARRLKTSRQTAARRLAELEKKGLIERRLETRGQIVRITPEGLALLRTFHRELTSIIKPIQRTIKLSGKVVTGIGEGKYYMSQLPYIKQFEKEIGFTPYPGTLDIKLEEDSVGIKEMLHRLPSGEVQGFETKERVFGKVKFFPAKIKNVKAAVVLPLRGHHTDILEIIAAHNLRNTLKLKDGDLVQVEVEA